MLIFNQQLQFPMRLPLIGNRVSGAVFYDAGNVFSSVFQITCAQRAGIADLYPRSRICA